MDKIYILFDIENKIANLNCFHVKTLIRNIHEHVFLVFIKKFNVKNVNLKVLILLLFKGMRIIKTSGFN